MIEMTENIMPILYRIIIMLNIMISAQANASVSPMIWVTGKMVAQNVFSDDKWSMESLYFNTNNTEVDAIGHIGKNDLRREIIFGVMPNTSSTIGVEITKDRENIPVCSLMISVDDHLNAELLVTDNASPDLNCVIDQSQDQNGFLLKIIRETANKE